MDPERAPALLVVIDTEEEFDWPAGFRRENTSVTAIAKIDRAQRIFDSFKVAPCYVVDYPVADQAAAYEPLREIVSGGRATLGAHLHPWVNPPFDEELSIRNSFPGNLPAELEAGKLEALLKRIEQSFGERPTVYKAGRYGLGRSTPRVLRDLGFKVDLSVNPLFDFSGDGGPDFSRFPSAPFWFGAGGAGDDRTLLGIPSTVAFVGALGRSGVAGRVHAAANGEVGMRFRTPAVLSRLRLLTRLRLSPEGYTLAEMCRLTRALVARGQRYFVLSFHSPSLEPGHTPYVRNQGELDRMLAALRGYFEFFFSEIGGRALTPLELRAEIERGPVA